jgi:hypothetical protein
VSRTLDYGPFLWSPRADALIFAGSALFALGLVAARHLFGASADLPEWSFLAFVLAVDVAHVYSTLFRTYLDPAELAAHRARYWIVPIAAYVGGWFLYQRGPLLFWRVLAYLALFHFVRQAAGWVAVYRARAGEKGPLERVIDELAIYASTLYPVVHWHAHLDEKHFAWFVSGDFAAVELVRRLEPFARWIWVAALAAFALREFSRLVTRRKFSLGRVLVVASTAATWYVGIVVTNSDFDFTVTNVITHGVPYVALLWAYARARRAEVSEGALAAVVRGGLGAFLGILVALAFAEELLWDRLVWHERSWLFGEGTTRGESLLAWVVPLLAVPQLTHYVLDGFLWRRGETRRLAAQRAALGFGSGEPRERLVDFRV